MSNNDSSPTVIITGANGNLGSVVTQHFLDNGYRVIATVINEAAKSDLTSHEKLEVHAVNLFDESETLNFIATVIEKHQQVCLFQPCGPTVPVMETHP